MKTTSVILTLAMVGSVSAYWGIARGMRKNIFFNPMALWNKVGDPAKAIFLNKWGSDKNDTTCRTKVNGCTLSFDGIWGICGKIKGVNFKPACDAHDACYMNCGAKETCDKRVFKANLIKQCKVACGDDAHGMGMKACKAAVNVYYKAVAGGGTPCTGCPAEYNNEDVPEGADEIVAQFDAENAEEPAEEEA